MSDEENKEERTRLESGFCPLIPRREGTTGKQALTEALKEAMEGETQ